MDGIDQFKTNQKTVWAGFAVLENLTGTVAPHLVRFAGIRAGQKVLDVACGTGVVTLTAARTGADVYGIDLTPELIVHARENAALMQLDATFQEGDAEALPFPDASVDVVVSQFGHMFAPRPDVVVAEMRRVLKPGGHVAFATWPPEHLVGRVFAFVGRNSPPPPPGAAPPAQWGIPALVAERLGDKFGAPFFERGVMRFSALSIPHFRLFMERSVGPMQKLVESLAGDPDRLERFRAEFEALATPYHFDNVVHQDYLLTRAQAA